MKTARELILVPVLFGFVLSTCAVIWGPSAISWFHEPPTSSGLVNCTPAVQWGIQTYQRVVGFAGALGLVLGFTAVIGYRLRRHPKASGGQSNPRF